MEWFALVREWVSIILLAVGTFFMFVAALGVLRMPDLFLRMSASTKAATLGAGAMLLGAAVSFGEFDIVSRAIAIIFFILLTAPVGAHMIGRAGYRSPTVKFWSGTLYDELENKFDAEADALNSTPPNKLAGPKDAGKPIAKRAKS